MCSQLNYGTSNCIKIKLSLAAKAVFNINLAVGIRLEKEVYPPQCNHSWAHRILNLEFGLFCPSGSEGTKVFLSSYALCLSSSRCACCRRFWCTLWLLMPTMDRRRMKLYDL